METINATTSGSGGQETMNLSNKERAFLRQTFEPHTAKLTYKNGTTVDVAIGGLMHGYIVSKSEEVIFGKTHPHLKPICTAFPYDMLLLMIKPSVN